MSDRPKIFIVGHASTSWNGDIVCTALAEDGEVLAGHISSNLWWACHDMGITGQWKRENYEKHCPDGYELVDLLRLSDDELAAHTGYMDAYARNQVRSPLSNTEESNG